MGWSDEYPHKIYASVLLDEEGKIINWRTGNYYWKEPCEAKMRLRDYNKIDKLTVKHAEFTVNNDSEHNKAFEVNAIEFYKKFKVAKDHIGTTPFEEDKFFSCEDAITKDNKRLLLIASH